MRKATYWPERELEFVVIWKGSLYSLLLALDLVMIYDAT